MGRPLFGLLGMERDKRKVSSCLSGNKNHNACCFISPVLGLKLVTDRSKMIFTEVEEK